MAAGVVASSARSEPSQIRVKSWTDCMREPVSETSPCALRLPTRLISVVSRTPPDCPTGMSTSSTFAVLGVGMFPVAALTSVPWTFQPELLVRMLSLPRWNAPSRVYARELPRSTTKKPFPSIAMSNGLPVVSSPPWLKSFTIEAVWTPSPICIGLMPPRSVVGAWPDESVCERRFENR